jgi:hypothetical protein
MAGLFAPSGSLDGIKVLAPTLCAHFIVVTVTALRKFDRGLLQSTTVLRFIGPISLITHRHAHHRTGVDLGMKLSSNAIKPVSSQNKHR